LIEAIKKALFDDSTGVFILGLALVTAGAYFIYKPAVFIVPGVVLMFLALYSLLVRKG